MAGTIGWQPLRALLWALALTATHAVRAVRAGKMFPRLGRIHVCAFSDEALLSEVAAKSEPFFASFVNQIAAGSLLMPGKILAYVCWAVPSPHPDSDRILRARPIPLP